MITNQDNKILIESMGKNSTLVYTRDKIILVSYQTCAAFYDKNKLTMYASLKFHSLTTNRHIAQFKSMLLDKFLMIAEDYLDQEVLDKLTTIGSLMNGSILTIDDRRMKNDKGT